MEKLNIGKKASRNILTRILKQESDIEFKNKRKILLENYYNLMLENKN